GRRPLHPREPGYPRGFLSKPPAPIHPRRGARGARPSLGLYPPPHTRVTREATAAAGLCLKQRPESFHVARDRDRVVRGFYAMFSPNPADATLVEQDPIASGWRRHIDANPMPYDQRPVFVRYLLSEQGGEM